MSNETKKELTAEELAAKTADAVVAKQAEKEVVQTPQGLTSEDLKAALEANQKATLDAMDAKLKEQHAQSKMTHPEGKTAGAPAIIQGHTRGYKSLGEGQKQLVDIALGREHTIESSAKFTSGDVEEVIALRTKAGKTGRAISGTKAIEADGNDHNPTDLASILEVRLGEKSSVANLFPSIEIVRGTAMDVPLLTTRPVSKLMATETSSPAATTIGQSKMTLTAQLIKTLIEWTDVADEDLAIALLPELENLVVQAMMEAEDSYILNGDTTAPHMDTDITAADDVRKTAKGLRKLALAGSLTTAFGNSFTLDLIDDLKASLGKYGLMGERENCKLILGASNYHAIETQSGFKEARIAADNATLIKGFPVNPKYMGLDVIGSTLMREDLDATGIYGAAAVQTAPIVVNVKQFRRGLKRNYKIEYDKDIKTGIISLVGSFRRDFQPVEAPSATISSVGLGINASLK